MSDSALELDELPYLVGRAWKLGDGIRAEHILSPQHADKDLAAGAFVLRGVAPPAWRCSRATSSSPVSISAAGAATRATARALRLIGAGAVIARSFGDEFARCALHVGLPPLQVEETEAIKTGDRLRVDIEGHKVVNLSLRRSLRHPQHLRRSARRAARRRHGRVSGVAERRP